MGHSLGEYAALVASGVMPFAHALEATAARGQEMTRVSVADPGWMAAVIGPYEKVARILNEADGYVVAANLNSHNQTVIGGASEAVRAAIERFNRSGLKAVRIPVSHAFHTQIVASAARPLRQVLDRLSFSSPQIPVIANVSGELYPSDPEQVKDYLERQIASPVQWAKGLETLYSLGVRVFMEVGPKKVLKGFVDNVLNGRPGLVSLFTNHPDFGEIAMFNQAICGLYAAGYAPVEVPRDVLLRTSRQSLLPLLALRPMLLRAQLSNQRLPSDRPMSRERPARRRPHLSLRRLRPSILPRNLWYPFSPPTPSPRWPRRWRRRSSPLPSTHSPQPGLTILTKFHSDLS